MKRIKAADLPPGPWTGEPDKLQWVDAATGLDCLIVRNLMGALCGYVGVLPGHPRHGQDYHDTDDLDVHGGITFAAGCDEDDPDGVCHVPEPGRPADVWWFGFDCSHYRDFVPYLATQPSFPASLVKDATYRDIPYVQGECAHLAEQLA